jgi:hypothetical protein
MGGRYRAGHVDVTVRHRSAIGPAMSLIRHTGSGGRCISSVHASVTVTDVTAEVLEVARGPPRPPARPAGDSGTGRGRHHDTRLTGWLDEKVTTGHWRTHNGDEVDYVIEFNDGQVLAFEVKANERVSCAADLEGLRTLRDTLGDRFIAALRS